MNVFKMKRFFKTLLIIACVISCIDCTHMKRRVQESIKDAEWIDSEGDFYTRAVGWDYYRLPLIDPFEADNIRGDDWGIQNHILDSISMLYSVDGIKGINVVKPYIFVYCESNNASDEFEQCGPVLGGQAVLKAWFVINVDAPDIDGFNNEGDYINYLRRRHISRPSLLDIDSVWQEFKETKNLPWVEPVQ